jgi:hypothetical protein
MWQTARQTSLTVLLGLRDKPECRRAQWLRANLDELPRSAPPMRRTRGKSPGVYESRAKPSSGLRCRLSLWVNSSLLRNVALPTYTGEGHFLAPLLAVPTRVCVASGTTGQAVHRSCPLQSEKAATESMRLSLARWGTPKYRPCPSLNRNLLTVPFRKELSRPLQHWGCYYPLAHQP